MQSADSSLGLSWWLLYQMPGKLQGFKLSEPLGFGWPDYLLPLLTSSSFIHWDASSRKPSAQKTTVHRWLCTRVYGRSRLDSGYAAFCSSSCSASSSSSTAPSNRSPLMKKFGVP